MKRFCLLLCLCLSFALPARAVEILELRVEPSGKIEHVALHLTGKAKYKLFRVESGQPRVALDLENTRLQSSLYLPRDYRGRLIRGVRFGFHDEATGRLVFDLNEEATPQNSELVVQGDGAWLFFDLVIGSEPEPKAEKKKKHHHEADKPKHDAKPVIVIDAGHGGQDPGTSGQETDEKDLTLRYALALERSLSKTGKFRVALTRSDDRYLFLRERVKRAREAHGDLFISLHADSAPTRYARGLSVYTISENASDKESEALAAKENRADIIGGMDLSGASDDVAGILIDLAERETRGKSAEFADLAIHYLGREVGLLSNTHRFAGFAVLKAPDIPSVLIEIGFLTNPKEESQLRSRAYEQKVVRGLTDAVEDYFAHQK